MRVIGTAGHVDHGKSTLVEALTGINPDRLKEERERQMTIDLGFAWLTLPGGEPVGVIDVPGHRDFIENMLAGVGGIDAALLVVAADEGIMPQTREHLAILDLLKIEAGVIALTKCDVVDADWQSLISAEVAAFLRGTTLAAAPLVAVSARTGEGLPELLAALEGVLAARPPRPDLGRPRLPVDRVFSMAGFGPVVTGTLADGALAVGDEVEILPPGWRARIRGLQTHKTKLEQALPGSRVAVNLSGVEVSRLRRGMVVARPDTLTTSDTLDARFDYLSDAGLSLRHNAAVKFFLGAAEVLGKVRLLEGDTLEPGHSAWVQIVLAEPVVAVKGDRFILRRPSPGATIGGGVIVDQLPKGRRKRRDQAQIARLETLAQGTPGDMLEQALTTLGPTSVREALARAALDPAAAAEALAALRAAGGLVELDGDLLVASRAAWHRLENEMRAALAAFHSAHPLRAGMPREELKSRVQLNARVFNAALAYAQRAGAVAGKGAVVRLPEHLVQFSPAQQAEVDLLLAEFRRDPHNTPSAKDCAARVGDEVLNVLVEQGALVPVSPEVLFLAETYAAMTERVRQHIRAAGRITVAEARDLFSTSRKYALALLEHLDVQGVTKRVGDERVLK